MKTVNKLIKEKFDFTNPIPKDDYNSGSFEGAWIAVDLDGTLAYYHPKNMRLGIIGDPIPKMLARVRKWQAEGKTVKLMTARASCPDQSPLIQAWLDKHNLDLEITNVKDFSMIELWDDRAIQVVPNTAERVDGVEE